MLRILFFFAAGGSVTLLALSASGSSKFDALGMVFVGAAIGIVALGPFVNMLARARRNWKETAAAKESGRVRAALILDRRQTGMFINEQPQVEFTLLVDRPGSRPFVTTTREVVSLLDLHEIRPGERLAVVHPDPEYGDVHIVAERIPAPSRYLNAEAAERAERLPTRRKTGGGLRLSSIGIYATVFFIGAVGAPFLVTTDAPEYARLVLTGRSDEVHRLDHAVLFELDELNETMAKVTAELGHDELFTVTISEVRMSADVPSVAGGDTSDTIRVQDHKVIAQEPSSIQPQELDRKRFRFTDVNWEQVYAGIPAVQDVAIARGLAEPVLERIHISRETHSGFDRIEVDVHFSGVYGDERVTLDASGAVSPSEEFDLLPEEEQETYLLDLERLEEALNDLVEQAPSEDIVQIVHYGDRLRMDVYADRSVVDLDYRYGFVRGIGEPDGEVMPAEKLFRIKDMDWGALLDSIPRAQQLMTEGGAADTEMSHIIIARDGENDGLIARVYVRNDAKEGGYVTFTSDGSIERVQGP